jgi:hypothetical protein
MSSTWRRLSACWVETRLDLFRFQTKLDETTHARTGHSRW